MLWPRYNYTAFPARRRAVIYPAVRSMMNILNSGRICAPSSLNQNLRSEGEDEYKARPWGHQGYTRHNPALHTLRLLRNCLPSSTVCLSICWWESWGVTYSVRAFLAVCVSSALNHLKWVHRWCSNNNNNNKLSRIAPWYHTEKTNKVVYLTDDSVPNSNNLKTCLYRKNEKICRIGHWSEKKVASRSGVHLTCHYISNRNRS